MIEKWETDGATIRNFKKFLKNIVGRTDLPQELVDYAEQLLARFYPEI